LDASAAKRRRLFFINMARSGSFGFEHQWQKTRRVFLARES